MPCRHIWRCQLAQTHNRREDMNKPTEKLSQNHLQGRGAASPNAMSAASRCCRAASCTGAVPASPTYQPSASCGQQLKGGCYLNM